MEIFNHLNKQVIDIYIIGASFEVPMSKYKWMMLSVDQAPKNIPCGFNWAEYQLTCHIYCYQNNHRLPIIANRIVVNNNH